MHPIIVQILNGVPYKETYVSESKIIDNGNSSIQGFSLFVHLNSEGEEIVKPKDTDDKIIIGYTHEGNAFQLVVDGFYGGERECIFEFIDDHVVPLLPGYSSSLSFEKDTGKVTSNLIHTIYELRTRHAPYAEFTMSLGVTYYKEKELFYAGFGIGDTGMLIKRTNGEIEQLVSHTEVDGFKDAFDTFSQTSIDLVISRNSMFNIKVNPGDEIVGYTYVQPDLEFLTSEFQSEGKQGKQQVRKLHINTSAYCKAHSLYEQLLTSIREKQKLLISQAKTLGKEQRFGDDFAIGRLVVPDEKLVQQLQIYAFSLALQSRLPTFIAQQNYSGRFFSLFAFFLKRNDTSLQATVYKNLLEKHQQPTIIRLFILVTILSTDNFNEVVQTILDDFDCASMMMFKKHIFEHLLERVNPVLNTKQLQDILIEMNDYVQKLDFSSFENLLNDCLIKHELKCT